MLVELVDLYTSEVLGSLTNYYHYFETGTVEGNAYLNGRPHDINIPLSQDSKYVLSIDIGTESLGFTIGDVLQNKPIYVGSFMRGDSSLPYTVFINEFTLFLNYFLDRVNANKKVLAYLKIESPFYNPYAGKLSYQRLKSIFDQIKNTCQYKGVYCYPCPPATWQSFYLGRVKEKYGIKLNKSNKKYIKMVGMDAHPSLVALKKQDGFDALGLYYHFMAVDYNDSGLIHVTPSLERSLKKINYTVYPYKEVGTQKILSAQDYLNKTLEHQTNLLNSNILNGQGTNNNNLNPQLVAFEFCQNLSIEDNIRALINFGDNVYYTVISPTVSVIKDLYKIKTDIPQLTSKTKLLIVGYRCL